MPYPLKENGPKSDMGKYGGYLGSGTAYFVVADSVGKKGSKMRSIEAVTIYHDKKICAGKMTIEEYLRDVQGLKNPELAKIEGLNGARILPYSLVMVDHKYCVRIPGYSGNSLTLNNANQLYVPADVNAYVKELRTLTEKVAKRTGNVGAKDKESAQEACCSELVLENERRKNDPNGDIKEKGRIIVVTKEKNIELYDFFIKKLSEKPFAFVPGYGALRKNLKNAKPSFCELNLYAEVTTLLNIIRAFQCNAKAVNASSLYISDGAEGRKYLGANLAKPSLNKEITGMSVVLVTQSRSGLREKRIEIGLTNYGIQDGSDKK